jgi:NAD(P)-dependent dehydrogenase (short-subunit alcohol dehydrogenase family)
MGDASDLPLKDKAVLITGSARRIGAALARACARAGANVVIHCHNSEQDAIEIQAEIESLGRRAWVLRADLGNPEEVAQLVDRSLEPAGRIYALVNNAAIFEPVSMPETDLHQWERHIAINLTAPFLLSQAFAGQVPADGEGRIVNLVDWRALRPGADHFPYTISKAALASMTKATAAALAPNISVNALALGAILPPTDAGASPDILKTIPAGRWGELHEVEAALLFLLAGPAYVTGEIIHVDGGRHLI